MPVSLTTTSYAILGQLALRPWTTYELAAEMRRNLHFFFPRAESQIYEEPKRLVAAGLAKATKELNGRRSRTVYAITPAGFEALRQWLATSVAKGPQLEFEALLRVMLAPFGTDEDLRQVLETVRAEAGATILTVAARISDEYVEGRAPFQRHAKYRSMLQDFLVHFGQLLEDWADRSLERVDSWPAQSEDERYETAVRIFDENRPKNRGTKRG